MKVLKFGGSSLATPATIRGVGRIVIEARRREPVIVDVAARFGARLSAVIVAAYLGGTTPSVFVDSRDIVVTDDQFTHAAVVFKKTNRRTRAYFNMLFRRAPRVTPVVTGFIGATGDGQT